MSPDPEPTPLRISVVGSDEDTGLRAEWRFENERLIKIGRSRDCDVRLDYPMVSRVHAIVQFTNSSWECSCTGKNGTFLNGHPVPAMAINNGLVLQFASGGPELQFDFMDSMHIDPEESESGDVSIWLEELASGKDDAAMNLYDRYFHQIANLARRRMSPAYRRVSDEEDVAQSVMHSLFNGITNGRYPELSDRESLWRLLVVMTARKAVNAVEKQRAQKRGGGQVRGESALVGPDEPTAPGFDRFSDGGISPDFYVQVAEESEIQMQRLADETLQKVAQLKMEGYTNNEIAQQIGTTTRTVERKLQRIREIWSSSL